MWTRGELKSKAKFSLRSKYWMAFAASLIVSLLGGSSGRFSWSFNSNDWNSNRNNGYDYFTNGNFQNLQDLFNKFVSSGIFLVVVILFGIGLLIGLGFRIFVSPVVQAGGCRWFSRSREAAATPTIGQVFSLFKSGSYLKTVGSMLWMNLFLFLWGLLAVVPAVAAAIALFSTFINIGDIQTLISDIRGRAAYEEVFSIIFGQILPYFMLICAISIFCSIPLYIKTYSYRMTPWILADNPQIGFRRALKLSMELTHGHKLNIWVLDLSFIGWFFLGGLACGVGVLFVMPYYNAVQAELFAILRQEGVNKDLCTMEEFGYIKVGEPALAGPEPAAF